MEYFLFIIISCSSIIAGMIIARFTKEELATGKKFFRIGQMIILSILGYILLTSPLNPSKILFFALFFLFTAVFLRLQRYPLSYLTYSYLGLVYAISPTNLTSSIIFLYGLPEGTLFAYTNNRTKDFLWKYLPFPLVATLLYLI